MNWKDKFNKKYMQISLYVIITSVIIYSLTLIAKNAPIIVHEIMEKVNWVIRVIRPVIIGFALAYLMDPVVNFFEKRFRKIKVIKLFQRFRAPRIWATIIATILLIIVFVGLISLLVFSVTDQLRLANFDDVIKLGEDYRNNFGNFYEAILSKMDELDIQSSELQQYVKEASTFILDALKRFANSALTTITNISGYLTTFIFSFIIGVYFMIDGRMFITYLKKVFMALFNDNTNLKLSKIAHDLDVVFSGYIRGQLTDAFIMMILISVTLSITGVKFAIVIGVFAGIGNLIPYFGPVIAYISTTIVCLIRGDIKILVISLIALVVIQAIDGNFIGPKLLSRSIKIHPLIVIISLIFGSALGGFLGMLLAVPVGAFIKVVFVRFVDHRIDRKEEQKSLKAKAEVKPDEIRSE